MRVANIWGTKEHIHLMKKAHQNTQTCWNWEVLGILKGVHNSLWFLMYVKGCDWLADFQLRRNGLLSQLSADSRLWGAGPCPGRKSTQKTEGSRPFFYVFLVMDSCGVATYSHWLLKHHWSEARGLGGLLFASQVVELFCNSSSFLPLARAFFELCPQGSRRDAENLGAGYRPDGSKFTTGYQVWFV